MSLWSIISTSSNAERRIEKHEMQKPDMSRKTPFSSAAPAAPRAQSGTGAENICAEAKSEKIYKRERTSKKCIAWESGGIVEQVSR